MLPGSGVPQGRQRVPVGLGPEGITGGPDSLSAATIERRLNYWTWLLGPKFSEKDRKAVNLKRDYSINQIEYCRNFIFKRHFPIRRIFEHSCEMGLFRLAADKVAYIFGVRLTKACAASCTVCSKNSAMTIT